MRLQRCEREEVGLLLRGVRAPGREWHGHGLAAVLRGKLDCGVPGQHDQVGKRYLLAVVLCFVESSLDARERGEYLRQLRGLIDIPFVLRRQADARAVRAAALVAAAEGRCRGPGGAHEFCDRQARFKNHGLQGRDVTLIDQRMVDLGHRVLPDQLFLRNALAEIPRARPHVAMRQLEPGARKGVGEVLGMQQEVARDLRVDGVEAQ